MKTTNSPSDDNIYYDQLIVYFDVIPEPYWKTLWLKYGKKHQMAFKCSYYFDGDFEHFKETWFIESTLFTKITKGEKI